MTLDELLVAYSKKIKTCPDSWQNKPKGYLKKPDYKRPEQSINSYQKKTLVSLMKSTMHHYNMRWFVLDKDKKTLTYYKDENADVAKGKIDLINILDVQLSSVFDAPEFSLDMVSEHRYYTIVADSQEQMVRWAYALRTAREVAVAKVQVQASVRISTAFKPASLVLAQQKHPRPSSIARGPTNLQRAHLSCVEIGTRTLEGDHRETLMMVRNMAMTNHDEGKYQIAEPLYIICLETCKRVLGQRHPDTLQAEANIAELYRVQGKFDLAEPILLKCYELRKQTQGLLHLDTAKAAENLAQFYQQQGNYDDAERLLVECRQIRTRLLGADHIETVIASEALVDVLSSQGKFSDAEPIQVQSLQAKQRTLGMDHLDTLASMEALATLHAKQGQFDKAEVLLFDSLERRRKLQGATHSDVLITASLLSDLYATHTGFYRSQKDFIRAEELAVKSLSLLREYQGPGHNDTVAAMQILADLYLDQDRYDAAEPLFLHCLQSKRVSLGDDHPETLLAMHTLAGVHRLQSHFTAAEQMFTTCLDKRKRILGVDHSDTVRTATSLAEVYRVKGEYPAAEKLYKQCIDSCSRRVGPDHSDTLAAVGNLATLYQAIGRYDLAEPLFVRCLDGSQGSVSRLSVVLKGQGKVQLAEQLQNYSPPVGLPPIPEVSPRSNLKDNNGTSSSAAPETDLGTPSLSVLRPSKFRHVFADQSKIEHTFHNLRVSSTLGDSNFIQANHLYFAFPVEGGGGAFSVLNLTSYRRFDGDLPTVTGHTAPIIDFDFNPFDAQVLASASEDCSIRLWRIPNGGLQSQGPAATQLCALTGHAKKVLAIKYHVSAPGVIVSASADGSTRLWDIERSRPYHTIKPSASVDQCAYDLVWNSLGSLYITSLKDRGLKFTDPRSASVALSVPIAHEGGKCIKLASLGDDADRLLTAGSSKSSLRQCKIWDPRNLSTEVSRLDVDSSPGALMPFYDPDTCLLYLAGKGDANIRYYEISAGAEFLPVSEFKSSAPAKGVAYVPKRALDAPNCEIGRLLKLTSSSVEPVRFYVPRRRSSAFPRDLFPDVRGDVPTHTAEQWMAGSDLLPALISLNPAVVDPQAAPAESSVSAFIASYASRRLSRAPDLDLLESQTRQALTEQIAAARRRIFFLESKLRKAGLLAL